MKQAGNARACGNLPLPGCEGQIVGSTEFVCHGLALSRETLCDCLSQKNMEECSLGHL